MLNKPKNEQPLKRTPSAAPNRRPKRCYLCKKNFAFDKYVHNSKVSNNILSNAIASKIKD